MPDWGEVRRRARNYVRAHPAGTPTEPFSRRHMVAAIVSGLAFGTVMIGLTAATDGWSEVSPVRVAVLAAGFTAFQLVWLYVTTRRRQS